MVEKSLVVMHLLDTVGVCSWSLGTWLRCEQGVWWAAQQELQTPCRANRDLLEIPVHKEWWLLSKKQV